MWPRACGARVTTAPLTQHPSQSSGKESFRFCEQWYHLCANEFKRENPTDKGDGMSQALSLSQFAGRSLSWFDRLWLDEQTRRKSRRFKITEAELRGKKGRVKHWLLFEQWAQLTTSMIRTTGVYVTCTHAHTHAHAHTPIDWEGGNLKKKKRQ